jgi:hypothetical protein
LKIRILIPLWKRPEVTRFCFEGVKRLQAESKHEIEVSCVLSEPEYIEMCTEFGFNWVFSLNLPLGDKMNTGIKSTLKYKYDYLMIMNSDDVIEAELIDRYYDPFFESLNPYFGIDKVTYVNWTTKEAREFQYNYTVLGIGKCIRKDVVELALKRLKEVYRAPLNKCLDDTMMDNMIKIGVYPSFVKYNGMLAMDFKSEVNIWPWEKFQNRGKKVCYKEKSEPASLIER